MESQAKLLNRQLRVATTGSLVPLDLVWVSSNCCIVPRLSVVSTGKVLVARMYKMPGGLFPGKGVPSI